MCAGSHVWAQDSASEVDKTFVGKVSQGGRYEVEAGKLALSKAVAQDVKDFAATDVHDHELVNGELKAISAKLGVAIAPTLIAKFQQKLDYLKGLSGEQFDAAYLEEMKAIHARAELQSTHRSCFQMPSESDPVIRVHGTPVSISGRRESLDLR